MNDCFGYFTLSESINLRSLRPSILYTIRTIGTYKAQSVEDWISILSLSLRWTFEGVSELAANSQCSRAKYFQTKLNPALELDDLIKDPIDRVIIARKWGIKPEWVFDGLLAICERKEPLKLEEAQLLSIGDVVNIAKAREAIMARKFSLTYHGVRRHSPHSIPSIYMTTRGSSNAAEAGATDALNRHLVAKIFGIQTASLRESLD